MMKANKTPHPIAGKTFILIHGSWHSAWNWHRVTPILEREGHTVYPIDLPAMGRDKTPVQDVSFEKTVRSVCGLLDTISGKVILVGHSKNGIVISQVAEYRPDKVEKLIYLAAYLIPNGKTQKEYSAMDREGWLKPYVELHPETKSHTLNPEIFREGLYHDCDLAITEMAKVILSHEPMESGSAVLNLSEEHFGRIPRYYIECTEDRAVTPFIQQKMYSEVPCRKVFRIRTGHSPFFSAPEELVNIFTEISLN